MWCIEKTEKAIITTNNQQLCMTLKIDNIFAFDDRLTTHLNAFQHHLKAIKQTSQPNN